MVSICRKVITKNAYKCLIPSVRSAAANVTTGNLVDAAGLEKQELLSKLAGNEDPFDTKVFKRGPSTKDEPSEIPSAFDARIVGCICEEDSIDIRWMWLHKGHPRKCECGYWFKLVPKPPV